MSQPEPKSNLSDQVVYEIKQRLRNGEFTPGQHLSEVQLCDALAVSRNTLREGFRTLIKEGLLVHTPNRGVSVTTPSLASVMDIYRVRRMVECQALARSHPIHPAHIAMRQAVDYAQQQQSQNDWRNVATANMLFHSAIVDLSDSPRIITLFEQVFAELRLVFDMLQDSEFLHAPYINENLELLKLVEAQQFTQAADKLDYYLNHSERVILTAYAKFIDAS